MSHSKNKVEKKFTQLSHIKNKSVKNITEIKERSIRGDIKLAAKLIGISPQNARWALKRVGSKYHDALLTALDKVITSRENLIKNRFN